MQLAEINIGQKGAFALASLKWLLVILSLLVVCVRPVNHELLGDAVGLNDDILNDQLLVGNLELVPSVSLVPRNLNLVDGNLLFGNGNDSSMIADFVNIRTRLGPLPVKTTVS